MKVNKIMKRVISSFDPEPNPTDAARSAVDMLNSDITKLHNIVGKWKKMIQSSPDDDSKMMKIADDSAYMQSEIDKMLDYYYKVLYSSNVM